MQIVISVSGGIINLFLLSPSNFLGISCRVLLACHGAFCFWLFFVSTLNYEMVAWSESKCASHRQHFTNSFSTLISVSKAGFALIVVCLPDYLKTWTPSLSLLTMYNYHYISPKLTGYANVSPTVFNDPWTFKKACAVKEEGQKYACPSVLH